MERITPRMIVSNAIKVGPEETQRLLDESMQRIRTGYTQAKLLLVSPEPFRFLMKMK